MRRFIYSAVSLIALVLAIVWVASASDLQPLYAAFAELSYWTTALVFALFVTAVLLAGLRLWFIARDIGAPISLNDAITALSMSSLAGVVFFQIMGQTIARSTLLARRGVPVAATLIMSGYERGIAMLISLLLATVGACYLFGKLSFDVTAGGGELAKIVVVLTLAVVAGAYVSWGRYGLHRIRSITLNPAFWGGLGRTTLSSVAIQLCTIMSYFIAALALEPDLGFVDLFAASAIVMLVSSLPISLAGWGIREISAVLALGQIGMPREKALVVALLIGTTSLAAMVVVFLAMTFSGKGRARPVAPVSVSSKSPDFADALAWGLSIAAVTAVFFQVHVPTAAGTKLNVNLADPFAIAGGVLFLLAVVRSGKWPRWRVEGLNELAVAATLVMTFGLLLGWISYGWTAWAFASKYLGWFVLLAYATTGALLVGAVGRIGCHVLLRAFVAAGVAVACFEIALVEASILGFSVPVEMLGQRASGLAANPNAFAFQMSLVACVAVAVIRSRRLAVAALTIVLMAIWLSASRAGVGAALLGLGAAAILLPSRRETIGHALFCAAALTTVIYASQFVPYMLQYLVCCVFDEAGAPVAGVPSAEITLGAVGLGSSDAERWQTLKVGLGLVAEHPIFGAGLGAFAESWRASHGEVQVIHSTPLWLLAEFGLAGLTIFVATFARIVHASLVRAVKGDSVATCIVLLCLVFATMSTVHELLYQRAFWLLLGITLATPHVRRQTSWGYHSLNETQPFSGRM